MTRLALCIGAPCSGATWLYQQIRKSQSVFAPPIKDVRYLCGRFNREKIRQTVENARQNVANCQEDVEFLDRYSFLPPDQAQDYQQLMTSVTAKPWSIDITPAYSLMKKRDVDDLSGFIGRDVPIFYVIRDIVDRSYSQANLHFHMHGTWKRRAPISEYMSLLSESSQIRRNDYIRTIDLWESAFGRDNVHVLFYEDLKNSPEDTIRYVFKVLGVENSESFSDSSGSIVGPNESVGLVQAPRSLKGFIAAQLLPLITEVAKRYPEKAGPWFDHALQEMNLSAGTQPEAYSGRTSANVLRNPARQVKAAATTTDAIKFLTRCVSLGDNCEFGFFLRSLGNEKGGLFRWAIARYNSIMDYITDGCPPMYSFENLKAYSAGMVEDQQTGFCFHTAMRSRKSEDGELLFCDDEQTRRIVHAKELEKIEFLRERFLTSLQSRDSIFVLKKSENLTDDQIQMMEAQLLTYRKYMETRIIVVLRTNDREKIGTIERLNPSVIKGYVARFAPYSEAKQIDQDAWMKIMTATSRLDSFIWNGDSGEHERLQLPQQGIR